MAAAEIDGSAGDGTDDLRLGGLQRRRRAWTYSPTHSDELKRHHDPQ